MKSKAELKAMATKRLVFSALLLGCMLFIPAGTLHYWEAWAFLAVLFIPMLLVFRHLLRHDPELLERRLEMREKEQSERKWMKLSAAVLLLMFLLPGLDHRFGWSRVPTAIILLADGAFLAGYALFFRVLKENSYASRTVEVREGQRVISTGPYRVVRHPMYAAVVVMYVAAPLALGSWWVLALVAIFLVFFLRFRILDEEKVLLRDLPGYGEYLQKVRWRLVPHVW